MKLNYKSFGEGEAVVILHGLFGMLDNWQSFAKELSKEYQVFIVDQRNHGKSAHSDDFNYELLAEDLRGFIVDQKIGPCHIIGHSMGGKTAMTFVKKYPLMAKSMIVVDITTKAYPNGHNDIFEAIQAIRFESLTGRKEAEDMLKIRLRDQGVIQFLLKSFYRKPNGSYEWKTNFESLFKNYSRITEAIIIEKPIETTTMFVKGKKSSYILESDLDDLRNIFKKLKIVELEAGHWIHAELPTLLLQEVSGFLKNV